MDKVLAKLKASEAKNKGGRPYRGAVRKTPPPSPAASPIVWAVWLGANTARRLAEEWGITRAQAIDRLNRAVYERKLRRLPLGRYGLACYRQRINGRFSGGAAVGDGVPWGKEVSCA